MADAELTLHEAAEVLGVHYMTAYRYVRLGLLPAVKSGGTWRVAATDVESFHTGAAATAPAGGRRRVAWAERLESRLVAGDSRGAWGVVEAALTSGAALDEVYLDILAPAMASIGTRWLAGELDVSVEHRASGIAMRIVGRLGPRFVRRGRTRGAVVVGAAAGERHSLPVALLADLLRGQGWDVSDLGADVPEASFVHAALTTPDLVVVGISVTTDEVLPSAASVLGALAEAVPGVLLVVGGAAVRDEAHALSLGAHAYARDGRMFAALLESRPAIAG
jgi:excisionase family DNA binding protein